MNRRLTLILFLIFAVLAILAWSLRGETGRQVGPGAPTATPGPMWDVAAKAVTKVDVKGGSNHYVLSLVDGKWQVDNQPANDEVAGVVERTSSPSVLRALPADRDPKTYGFASPALTVTFTVSATDHVLLVGDTLPTSKTDRYVMIKDGTTIFSVGGADLTKLLDWLTAPPLAPTATPPPTSATTGTPGTAAAGATGTPGAVTALPPPVETLGIIVGTPSAVPTATK